MCESKGSVLSQSLHTCFSLPCQITVDDNNANHVISLFVPLLFVYVFTSASSYFGPHACVCVSVKKFICENVCV